MESQMKRKQHLTNSNIGTLPPHVIAARRIDISFPILHQTNKNLIAKRPCFRIGTDQCTSLKGSIRKNAVNYDFS